MKKSSLVFALVSSLTYLPLATASEVIVLSHDFNHEGRIDDNLIQQDFTALDKIARGQLSCLPEMLHRESRTRTQGCSTHGGDCMTRHSVMASYECFSEGTFIKASGTVLRDPYEPIDYAIYRAEREALKYATKWCLTPRRELVGRQVQTSPKSVFVEGIYDCEFY